MMMKNFKTTAILIILIFIVMTNILVAQEPASKIALPETVFDFGFFADDARVVHTFTIKNEGDDTLRIIKVKPGCGCTAAPLRNANIAPNDSTFVDVYFDSKRLTGLVKKKVTILSNDPINPLMEAATISITGKKHPYIQYDPEVINFGRLSADKLDKEYVSTLTNITDADVELEIVDYSIDYIDVALKSNLLKPGESTEFVMTLRRIPLDPNFYNFSATLSANIKDIKIHLTIPAFGRMNRVD